MCLVVIFLQRPLAVVQKSNEFENVDIGKIAAALLRFSEHPGKFRYSFHIIGNELLWYDRSCRYALALEEATLSVSCFSVLMCAFAVCMLSHNNK